jgi:hypothetical protein
MAAEFLVFVFLSSFISTSAEGAGTDGPSTSTRLSTGPWCPEPDFVSSGTT